MSTTDLKHWAEVAQREPTDGWFLRAELAAHFIRSGDVVCDLGAGAQIIKRFLPPSTGYIPVDCVKEHEDTYVVDFNESFSLPDKPFNVILCLGLLRYIKDLPGFFENLSAAQPGKFIIFSYGFRKRRPGKRRFQQNIESLDAGLHFFSQYVDGLTVIANILRPRNRFMFCGTLGRSAPQAVFAKRRSLRDIICSNTSLAEFMSVHVRKFSTTVRYRVRRIAGARAREVWSSWTSTPSPS